MADVWYYAQGDQRKGPVEAPALKALVDAGVVRSDTLVWREGMSDWEPAFRHVPGLAPDLPPSPATVPAAPGARSAGVGYATAPARGAAYDDQVGMAEAFRRFWRRYVDFSGRSNRGEYWWAVLALLLLSIVVSIVDIALFDTSGQIQPLSSLLSLATLIPGIAMSVRRLHDTDRSGWWILLGLVPIVGWIILLVWYCQRPDPRPNRFG